jgi:UDP-N-acetylglucosamine:LPS N-acetylglucosamine transferase
MSELFNQRFFYGCFTHAARTIFTLFCSVFSKVSIFLPRMSPNTSGNLKVLFFSRGRGHGHAIPDMEIVSELGLLDSSIRVQFVSYSTGAETFKNRGIPVIDMELPENNMFLSTQEKAFRLITEIKPQVVVAHEEFAALSAAKLANVPTVYVSAWLPAMGTIQFESLLATSGVLVTENPGVFPMPVSMRGRIAYTGPIFRKLKYTWFDRSRLRTELGITADALAILVVQGGWTSEERAPIVDTVISAFLGLREQPKHLFWLAGRDAGKISLRTKGLEGVEVLSFVDPVERIMAACDVVITKGTHGITLDAASAGVPSISLSPGLNPIDDVLVPRIRNNIALNAVAVDEVILRKYIETVVVSSTDVLPAAGGMGNAKVAAKHLLEMLRSVINEQNALQEASKAKFE